MRRICGHGIRTGRLGTELALPIQMTKAQLELTRTARKPRGPRALRNPPIELESEDTELQETLDELSAELGHLEELAEQTNRLKAQYSRACATIAQTDNEYFRVMCKVMDPLAQSFPHHPMIRKWSFVRKLWQLQLLKQN
jgi:hypothetical protein